MRFRAPHGNAVFRSDLPNRLYAIVVPQEYPKFAVLRHTRLVLRPCPAGRHHQKPCTVRAVVRGISPCFQHFDRQAALMIQRDELHRFCRKICLRAQGHRTPQTIVRIRAHVRSGNQRKKQRRKKQDKWHSHIDDTTTVSCPWQYAQKTPSGKPDGVSHSSRDLICTGQPVSASAQTVPLPPARSCRTRLLPDRGTCGSARSSASRCSRTPDKTRRLLLKSA